MVFSFRLEWDKIGWERVGKDGATALANVFRVTKDFTILKFGLPEKCVLIRWAIKFYLSSFVKTIIKYLLALILEFSPL